MSSDEYMTAEEVRKQLGISKWKMSKLLGTEIPFTTSAWDKRVKLIKKEDVEAWLAAAGPRVRREPQESVWAAA